MLKLRAKTLKWQLSFFFQGRSSWKSKCFKGKTKLEWPSSPLKFVGNETEIAWLPAPSQLKSSSAVCWNQLRNSAPLIIVRLWLRWPSSNPSVPTRAKKQGLQAVGTHGLEATLFFTSQNFMLWTRLYFDYILHVQNSQQALFQSWLRRIASSLSIGSDTPSSVKGVCPARILSGCDAPNCTSNRQKTEKVQMWLEILSGRLL